eukprot:m.70242 g.70242  ORF g.70242 m.70242 type:complete len:98 (+) comp12118_c0_seq2:187-480(+)
MEFSDYFSQPQGEIGIDMPQLADEMMEADHLAEQYEPVQDFRKHLVATNKASYKNEETAKNAAKKEVYAFPQPEGLCKGNSSVSSEHNLLYPPVQLE